MTDQLRPAVIVVALVALLAGVIGLRTLASSESGDVPVGQPFMIEADYPEVTETVAPEPAWTRTSGGRNPFVAAPDSVLAPGSSANAANALLESADTDALGEPDGPAEQGLASTPGSGTNNELRPQIPLGKVSEPPTPGTVIEIEITPDDPNGTGSGGLFG